MQQPKENNTGIFSNDLNAQTFYHGSKAQLKVGDLIKVGHSSNYGKKQAAKYIYLSATLEAAIWGAELAAGDERQRIYIVEPTGPIEDDPNLTDKKFPGNPTKSYRSLHPFKIIGEVESWQGHSSEQLQHMRDGIKKLEEQGIYAIEE